MLRQGISHTLTEVPTHYFYCLEMFCILFIGIKYLHSLPQKELYLMSQVLYLCGVHLSVRKTENLLLEDQTERKNARFS